MPAPRANLPAVHLGGLPWFDDDAAAVSFLDQRARLGFTPDEVEILTRGQMSASGISISHDQALRVATVFACRRVIAEDVGKLPPKLIRRGKAADGGTRTRPATDDPRHELLTERPNDWMTIQELLEYMVGQAVLRGAGYAWIIRDAAGMPVELLPLLPGTCARVMDERWDVSYEVTGYSGGTILAGLGDIWCLNGFIESPVSGFDMSTMAREAVGLAAAIEASQARFHAKDMRPAGILTTKASLKPEQRETIRAAWEAAYGQGGRGGIAVLDAEFDFKALAPTAADSQTIQNREFQIEEVCRFFRVHPWAVMRQQSSQSYGSLEQTALAHLQQTILPWVNRVELSVKRDVLAPLPAPGGRLPGGQSPGATQNELFYKLNMAAIARATLGDRVSAYEKASKVFLTPNEIRELEDLDPIDDPAADRVQFLANNTGLKPGVDSSVARPDSPAGSRPGRADKGSDVAEAARSADTGEQRDMETPMAWPAPSGRLRGAQSLGATRNDHPIMSLGHVRPSR